MFLNMKEFGSRSGPIFCPSILLGLNCMQNLPADETFADKALKHSMNGCYCIYDIETLLVKKSLFNSLNRYTANVLQNSFGI